MTAILRTHGGLGNQLFQVLYGRLFAEQFRLDLVEVHDISYNHHQLLRGVNKNGLAINP
jgi:hypothetical protein